MEMKAADSLLWKLLVFLAAMIATMQMFALDGLVSGLFLLTFPVTALLWLRTVRQRLSGNDLLVLLTVALAALSVLLDLALSGGSLGFDYLKKCIMFAMTLLLFQAASRYRAEKRLLCFIGAMADGLTVLFAAMFCLQNERMHSLNGQVTAYLTFGFTNPNLATLFLTMLYMLQLCRVRGRRKWWHVAFAAVLLYFMVLTRSRNALLTVTVFTVWAFFARKRENVRIGSCVAPLIAWLPAIFALVYMAVVSQEPVRLLFAFLSGEGKTLDARVEVWQRALSAVWTSPLWGSYYAISDGIGMSQMHNSHLDIAASYGIPVLILVCMLLSRWLRQRRGKYMIGFACALLLGLGEAAMFSGGLGIYIFAGLFLLLAKGEKDEDRIFE